MFLRAALWRLAGGPAAPPLPGGGKLADVDGYGGVVACGVGPPERVDLPAEMRVPVVFNLVVGPSRQVARDQGPPVSSTNCILVSSCLLLLQIFSCGCEKQKGCLHFKATCY